MAPEPVDVAVAQNRNARIAVAALFLSNGALFANLLPRYPEIKTDLHLSNAVYGAAIAAFSAGALVAGLGRRDPDPAIPLVTSGCRRHPRPRGVRSHCGSRRHAADPGRGAFRRGRVGCDHRRRPERARIATTTQLRPIDHQLVSRRLGGGSHPRRTDGRRRDRAGHLSHNTFGDRSRRFLADSS